MYNIFDFLLVPATTKNVLQADMLQTGPTFSGRLNCRSNVSQMQLIESNWSWMQLIQSNRSQMQFIESK